MKAVLGVIAALIVAVALLVGLYFLGWAITRENAAQQREANHAGQPYQDAKVAQERALVNGIAQSGGDQKALLTHQFCSVYSELTDIPGDLSVAHSSLC